MSGHGGNIWQAAKQQGLAPEDLLDFSANINPLGPPPFLASLLLERIADLGHYPDPSCAAARKAIAAYLSLDRQEIILGNGTSELLFALPGLLDVKRALIPVPSYIDYHTACARAGLEIRELVLDPGRDFQPDPDQLDREIRARDLVLLGQPNNPTGAMMDRGQLLALIKKHPDAWFVVDEAFAPFVPDYQSLAGSADNLIVLCSLTKIFAVAGLRLGFAWASPEIAARLGRALVPWNVNSLAQACIERCFASGRPGQGNFDLPAYLRATHELVAQERAFLTDELVRSGHWRVFPGQANFLLLALLPGPESGVALAESLLARAS